MRRMFVLLPGRRPACCRSLPVSSVRLLMLLAEREHEQSVAARAYSEGGVLVPKGKARHVHLCVTRNSIRGDYQKIGKPFVPCE